MTSISFADNVRIRDTALTRKLGLAGRQGPVHGETTPSSSGADVIGDCPDDYASAVFLEDRSEALWFAPELLEFIDHGAVTTMSIDGSGIELVRDEDGSWHERPLPAGSKRPWWRFWGG